ncbi:metallophosphoesterase family protein [Sphingomonas hankookensis]|uniref:metallophosphoesterase family protein n=1 Tax=Sphingomonas hankookensis TaxID=563996 RepID=UPI001F55AA6C|nr:metallophosphoesterase family protein [Sphingomonas hankookensis]
MVFSRLFRKSAAPAPRIPDGQIVYAIGDVHGRLDCLEDLLARIDADPDRGDRRVKLIFLGDLIDRGPDSRGVVERVMTLCAASEDVTCLCGNHEELLLHAAEGARQSLGIFVRAGGRETLLSYGVDEATYEAADLKGVAQLVQDHVPTAHLDFLRALPDQIAIGDYVMVHAGIRPGVALDAQKSSDLRWIRAPFLDHTGRFERFVVHGHTVTAEPDIRPNRIGIDTGAYRSGRLTALVLHDEVQRFLTTALPEGTGPSVD